MPMIGCGLDGLSWPAVRTLVKNVFQLDRIKITVYHFGQGGTTNVKTEPGTSKKENQSISEMFKKESIKREHDDKPIIKSPKRSSDQPSISKHFESKVKNKLKLQILDLGIQPPSLYLMSLP
eukprot:TRINITY_DN33459_c0_g1_i1.p1 TRINITY_DN33459_c0_g1~~TRINITY_DN33459_c0_g1_i1.p1  ORF type:complete len:129 (-),score=25.05 TRINITY_DN33459_c0_g1_i1:126-491(-)